MKRGFWMGVLLGLAAGSLLRRGAQSSLTQSRLDAYYQRRAPNYNATDNLNLFGYYPRISMRQTIMAMANLQPGDRVLDFACGAGANFPYILERIGPTGRLVAVDYSGDMLAQAQTMARERGWNNIEFIQSDAATMQPGINFDVVLCTLGLVVIPHYEEAMQQGWDALKPGGIYAIADIAESEHWYARSIGWFMRVLDLFIVTDTTRRPWEWLAARAENFERRELFFGYFYAATGRKPL